MKLNKLWAGALALFALASCNQDLEPRQEQLQTPQVETKLMDARLEIGAESAMRVAYGLNPDPNAKGATNGLLLNSDKDLSIRLAVRETTSNRYTYQTLTFKKSASGNSALFVGKISVPAFPEGTDLTTLKFQISGRLSAESFAWGMLVCHQAFVCKRSIAPEYDLRYRYSADVDWCIRAMRLAENYLFIDNPPIARYLHEGTTTQHRWVSLGERFDVMRRHYGLVSTLLRHIVFPMRLIGQKLLAMLRRL